MAFIDIKDPIKREEIVNDYIKNIKEIRARSENEKMRGISQRQDLAKVFQPVVQATEKSASQITSELKNLKEEVQLKEESKPVNKALEYYLNQVSKSKLDQYFGIFKENGIYMMGDKDTFFYSPALWRLIMYKTPVGFEHKDLVSYKELLDKTNVIYVPHKTNDASRPTHTAKWKFFRDNGLLETEEDRLLETEEEDTDDEKDGSGIQFLPGNINDLIEQLHLLLAESRAGNKASTRNQIVAILDELLKRNYLSQEEYNGVCETISC